MKEIIAKRYAKALIQIGREDGQYERYAEELKSFGEVLEASSELKAVMENPIYDRDQKKAIFQALNRQLALSPIIINFILFIIDKRRVGYFDEIIRSYDQLADELAGRARARAATPAPFRTACRAARIRGNPSADSRGHLPVPG